MITVPCPRCGMPVGLEEEICPHCRTPRDDMEMEEGRALVRAELRRRKRRPRLVASGVAVAILLVSAWLLRARITAPLRAAWRDFAAEVERTRQPEHWLAKKGSESTAAPEVPPAQIVISSIILVGASPPEPPSVSSEPTR